MTDIDVHLYRPSTGERRIHQPDYGIEDDLENPWFVWEEGNFACDCNRSLMLYDWNEEKTLPCDNGVNREIYIERIVVRGTNKVLYSEAIPQTN